jgi:hypothetical protein
MRHKNLHPVQPLAAWAAIFTAVIVSLVLPIDLVLPDEPMPSSTEDQPQQSAESLVQLLGDENFATREQASSRLVQLGAIAVDALKKGTQHPDREIRYRCHRILTLVEEFDFQRRLDAFAAGDDQHGLPGWQRYDQAFGDQPHARDLFLEMQKAEPDIMQSIDEGPQQASKMLALRCDGIQQQQTFSRNPVPLGSIVAMLFAASDEQVRVPQTTGSTLATLCYQPEVQNAMNHAGRSPILRQLLGDWIRRNDTWAVFQNLSLAMRYEMKEGLVAARGLIENPGNQPYIRQNAILAIVKLGDRDDIPLLATLLEDESRCAIQRVQDKTYETQLRDVALAAILLMQGDEPKEYGFERMQLHNVNVFVTGTAGFDSDEKRQAALAKFRESRDRERSADP